VRLQSLQQCVLRIGLCHGGPQLVRRRNVRRGRFIVVHHSIEGQRGTDNRITGIDTGTGTASQWRVVQNVDQADKNDLRRLLRTGQGPRLIVVVHQVIR